MNTKTLKGLILFAFFLFVSHFVVLAQTGDPNLSVSFTHVKQADFSDLHGTARLTISNSSSAAGPALNVTLIVWSYTERQEQLVKVTGIRYDADRDGICEMSLNFWKSENEVSNNIYSNSYSFGPRMVWQSSGPDPDGVGGWDWVAGDQYGIGRLPVGTTVVYEIDYTLPSCSSVCTGIETNLPFQLNYDTYSRPSGSGDRPAKAAHLGDLEGWPSGATAGPTTINAGVPTRYSFHPKVNSYENTLRKTCGLSGYYVELTLPDGVSLAPNAYATYEKDWGYDGPSPVTVVQDPGSNVVKLLGGGISGYYRLNLSLGCSGLISGSQKTLGWKLKYNCSSDPSCDRSVICSSYSITTSNDSPGQAGPISGSATVYKGQIGVEYSVPVVANASGYEWILPAGAIIISGANTNKILISYSTSSESGTIKVRALNNCNNGAFSEGFPVTVNAGAPVVPKASISGTTTICEGQSTYIGFVCTDGIGNYTVYYTYNNGSTSTSHSIAVPFLYPSYSYTYLEVHEAGTYTLTSVVDADGNTATVTGQSATITIPPLVGAATIIQGPSTVVAGENNVTFTVAPISGADYYYWSYTGQGISTYSNSNTLTTSVESNATSGVLTVSGSNNCNSGSTSLGFPITVVQEPMPPVIISNQNQFKRSTCTGRLINKYTMLSTQATYASYLWYRDTNGNHVIDAGIDEQIGTEQNVFITQPGIYIVQVTNASGVAGSSVKDMTYVQDVNTQQGGNLICNGDFEWSADISLLSDHYVHTTGQQPNYADGVCGWGGCINNPDKMLSWFAFTTDNNYTFAIDNYSNSVFTVGNSLETYNLSFNGGSHNNVLMVVGPDDWGGVTPYYSNYDWMQQVAVAPNTNYQFSFYVTKITDQVQFRPDCNLGPDLVDLDFGWLNGSGIFESLVNNGIKVTENNGTPYSYQSANGFTITNRYASNGAQLWYKFTYNFNSGDRNTITFQIKRLNRLLYCFGWTPSVYALDDISLVTYTPEMPKATITGTSTICSGQVVNLSISCTKGTPPYTVNYEYSDGTHMVPYTITVPNTEPYALAVQSAGTYAIISVTDHDNNSSDITGQSSIVTVNYPPTSAGTISGETNIQPGRTGVIYTVPPIDNATEYVWSLPAGATITSGANTNSITLDYAADAVSGTISVFGKNGCGNGNPSNLSITVSMLPGNAGSISGSYTVCQGQQGVVYSIPPVSGATSYAWSYSGTGVTIMGNSNAITINFSSDATSGDLLVYGLNSYGNGSPSSKYPVVVNPLPHNVGSYDWKRKDDLPGGITFSGWENRAFNQCFSSGTNGFNFFIESFTGNSFSIFNSLTDTWTRIADCPDPLNYALSSCFAIGNKVYINVGTNTNFWEYDLSTKVWTRKKDTPEINTVNNGLSLSFIIGSKGYIVLFGSDFTFHLWEYDPALDTWTEKASLPEDAELGCCTVFGSSIGNKGYLFSSIRKTLYEYDLSTNTWARKNDFPGSIIYPSVVFQLAGKLYAGFGINPVSMETNDVIWEYDPTTNQWIEKLHYPGAGRDACVGFSIGNKVYIGGGSGANDFWEYSLSKAIITGSGNVCQNQSGVAYSIPAIANASSYTWAYSGTGATIHGSGDAITIDFAANATSGDLTVKGVNSCGESELSKSLAIAVNKLPEPAGIIGGETNIQQGRTGVVYTVPPITNATEYVWSLPAGAIITSGNNTNSITVDFSASGVSGIVSVYGKNSCGNGAISNLPVTVTAGSIPANQSFCPGATVANLVATDPNGREIRWYDSPVGGNLLNATTVLINGDYYAELYNSTTGETGPARVRVTVTLNSTPAAPVGLAGTQAVCVNQTNASYSVTASTDANGYIWNLPSGATITSGDANSNSVTVSFLSVPAGSYQVSILARNACGNSSQPAVLPISIGGTNPIMDQPKDASACDGQDVSFTVGAAGDNLAYQWSYFSTYTNEWKIISGANEATYRTKALTKENGSLFSCNITGNICGTPVNSQTRDAKLNVNTAGVGAAGVITGATVAIQGQPYIYSVPEVENATEYVWNLPVGANVTSEPNVRNITVKFSNPITNAAISVFGRNACSAGTPSGTLNVSVSPLPNITATITGSAVADSGEVVPLTIICTGSQGPYTVTYQYYNGTTTVLVTVTIPDNKPFTLFASETSTYTLVSIKDKDNVTVPITGQTATARICERQLLSISPSNLTICVSDQLPLRGSIAPYGVLSGPGVTGNGDGTATFSSATAGDYEVTYTYTDAYSCVSTCKTTITTKEKPAVSFTGLNDSYLYESGNSTLSVTPAGGAFSGYSAIRTASDGSFVFSPSLLGEYNVKYTYQDAGCANSQTQTVTVYSKPLAVLKGTGVMCDGQPTELLIHFVGKAPYNFKYTDGTTESSLLTTNNSTYSIMADVVGMVYSLTYFSDSRMEGDMQGSIQIVNQVPPTASISGNLRTCADQPGTLPVVFNGYGNKVFQYAIDGLPQSEVATDQASFNLRARYSGTYTLLSVKQRGCPGTVSGAGQVIIDPLPSVGINNLATTYCVGTSAVTISGWPAGGTLSSNIPGFTTGVGSTATFTPNNPGEYNVDYTYSDGRCSNSKSMRVLVVTPPTATFGQSTNYCGNTPGSIEVTFTGKGNYALSWTRDGESSSANYDDDGIIVADHSGLYSLVSVTSYGCPGTVSGEVTIYKSDYPVATMPKSIPKCPFEEINVPVALTGVSPWVYKVMDVHAHSASYPSTNGSGAFTAVEFGKYTITSVKDAYCESKELTSVEILEKSVPKAKLTGLGGIFSGKPAKLVVKLSDAYKEPYTFVYSINGVSQQPIVTNGPQYTILATTIGLYKIESVTAAGCNGSGSSGGGGVIDVEEHDMPTVTIKGGCELKIGEPMDLSCTFTGTPVWTLTYTINGGAEQTATFTEAQSALRIYSPGLYKFISVSDYWGENVINQELLIQAPGESIICEDCIPSFAPIPGQKYVLGAWAKLSNLTSLGDYSDAGITLYFEGSNETFGPFKPKGPIIDGWQRIEEEFIIPNAAKAIEIKLVNLSASDNAFFDDIRIYPFKGNIKSYVYDPVTLRLKAVLDENNYATYYEYDEEGRLIRVKKETERGIKTIQESYNNVKVQTE